MKDCEGCKRAQLVARELRLCRECITVSDTAQLLKPHIRIRESLDLPPAIPKGGIPCTFCSNLCEIPEGARGYCGLRENIAGKMHHLGGVQYGLAHTYYDPIPTNCCAAWFCAPCQGKHWGFNLAVFFYGCNFDCLFCQNWQHKRLDQGERLSVEEFVQRALRPQVRCICFFGGSPEPQFPFALKASEAVLKETKEREMRICWEWNGCGNPAFVRRAAELSLRSGGTIKFDLKAWDRNLALALSGVPNERAYENFAMIAREYQPKAKHPLLTATTLLVTGYVDEEEVFHIARFIARLNPEIPYSLLIFRGDFAMRDLPPTPLEQAIRCYRAAKAAGLKNIHVGNLHLLRIYSMEDFEALARS